MGTTGGFRRAASLLLAMALAACGKSGGISVEGDPAGGTAGNAAMGRYVEGSWALPAGVESIGKIIPVEGGFDVIAMGEDIPSCAHSADGQSWEERDADRLGALYRGMGEGYSEMSLERDAAGVYTLLCTENETQAHRLLRCGTDGTVSETPIDWQMKPGPDGEPLRAPLRPKKMRAGGDGSIFLQDMDGGISRYSAFGEWMGGYPGADTWAVNGDTLAACTGSDVVFHDLDTGQKTGSVPLLDEMYPIFGITPYFVLSFDARGGLYLCGKSGIYRIAPGGELFERMLDGSAGTLGMPAYEISTFAAGEDGAFLLSLYDSAGRCQLIRYRYDGAVPTRASRELTVHGLIIRYTHEQAAIQFQKENPEVRVTLRSFYNDDYSNQSDAERALATEIMAGKGPDVLALDNMDLDAYTEKGILLDLRGGVGGMMDSGEVMPNIVGAYGSQRGLFAVPARLGLPCLVSAPENIRRAGTLASIAQFAREHPEKSIFHEARPEMLMATFYLSCAPAWFQTPGTFGEPLFIRFLEDIQALSRDAEEGEPNNPAADTISLAEMAAGRTEYHFTVSWGFSSIRGPYAAAARRAGDPFAPRDFSECIAPLPGQSAGMDVFSPMCILGVNARSENREDALAFIRTALSRDVQRTDLGDGYPVNTQALRDGFDRRVNEWRTIIGDEIGIPGFTLEMPSPPIEAQEAVADLLKALKTPVQTDYAMQEIITGEAAAFFEGTATAAEAASAVAGRIQAYLTE